MRGFAHVQVRSPLARREGRSLALPFLGVDNLAEMRAIGRRGRTIGDSWRCEKRTGQKPAARRGRWKFSWGNPLSCPCRAMSASPTPLVAAAYCLGSQGQCWMDRPVRLSWSKGLQPRYRRDLPAEPCPFPRRPSRSCRRQGSSAIPLGLLKPLVTRSSTLEPFRSAR